MTPIVECLAPGDPRWSQLESPAAPPEASPLERALMLQMADAGGVLLWAEEGERALGRAMVGSCGGDDPRAYYVGFFAVNVSEAESPLRIQVYSALLKAAQAWVRGLWSKRGEKGSALHDEGTPYLVAPMNGNSWFTYRLRDDDDPRSFPWEPPRDPSLKKALVDAGFEEHQKYHTLGSVGLERILAHCAPAYQRAMAQKFRLEPFTAYTGARGQVLLQDIWSLSHRAFAKSPHFAPISLAQFAQFYASGFGEVPRDLGRVLLAPDGAMVGFMWNFMTQDESAIVYKSMAIDGGYQGQRLGDVLLYEPTKEALAQGAVDYVSALMTLGNRSEFIARMGETRWEHRYATWIWRL